MPEFSFSEIGADACIGAIGSLFRPIGGGRWSINVDFWPRQKKTYLSMSNAPVLSRKRVLNSDKEHSIRGWRKSFSIANTSGWKVGQIREIPIQGYRRRQDARQFCFVFTIGCGVTVYLPQFELARALFFHNSYLSRTSLDPSSLRREFDIVVDPNGKRALINILPSSGYTFKHCSDPTCRQALSWILLDAEARSSYESVGERQLRLGRDCGRYRFWDFSFIPPSLPKASFQVRGHFNQALNCLFVYEIDAIHNVRANLPDEIEFHLPACAMLAQGQGDKVLINSLPPSEVLDIEDGSPSHLDNGPTVIKTRGVALQFDKVFHTQKKVEKEKSAVYGQRAQNEIVLGGRSVSTEEAVINGIHPSADWDTLNDDATDYSHLFDNKFKCFKKMLEALVQHHGCTMHANNVTPLPKVPRCRKHLLADGSSRCLADVFIQIGDTYLHLLEVDTSDANKPLSTQILRLEDESKWDKELEKIKYSLIRSSLSWPTSAFTRLCGAEGFKGVPHPHTPSANKGVLSADSIAGWAERVSGWMRRMEVG